MRITPPQPEAKDPQGDRYTDVEGWLKLFCLVLVFVYPLFTIINLISEISSIKQIPWFFWGDLNLRVPMILGIILSIALMLFSIYVGYALFTRTDRKAIRIAKAFLLTIMVSRFVLVVGMVFIFLSSRNEYAREKYMGEIIIPYALVAAASFIGAGIGLMYLHESERVKATYVN